MEDNLQKFEKFEKFIQASDMLSDKINEADQFLISACGGNSEGVFFEINGNHDLLVDAITFIIESMNTSKNNVSSDAFVNTINEIANRHNVHVANQRGKL